MDLERERDRDESPAAEAEDPAAERPLRSDEGASCQGSDAAAAGRAAPIGEGEVSALGCEPDEGKSLVAETDDRAAKGPPWSGGGAPSRGPVDESSTDSKTSPADGQMSKGEVGTEGGGSKGPGGRDPLGLNDGTNLPAKSAGGNNGRSVLVLDDEEISFSTRSSAIETPSDIDDLSLGSFTDDSAPEADETKEDEDPPREEGEKPQQRASVVGSPRDEEGNPIGRKREIRAAERSPRSSEGAPSWGIDGAAKAELIGEIESLILRCKRDKSQRPTAEKENRAAERSPRSDGGAPNWGLDAAAKVQLIGEIESLILGRIQEKDESPTAEMRNSAARRLPPSDEGAPSWGPDAGVPAEYRQSQDGNLTAGMESPVAKARLATTLCRRGVGRTNKIGRSTMTLECKQNEDERLIAETENPAAKRLLQSYEGAPSRGPDAAAAAGEAELIREKKSLILGYKNKSSMSEMENPTAKTRPATASRARGVGRRRCRVLISFLPTCFILWHLTRSLFMKETRKISGEVNVIAPREGGPSARPPTFSVLQAMDGGYAEKWKAKLDANRNWANCANYSYSLRTLDGAPAASIYTRKVEAISAALEASREDDWIIFLDADVSFQADSCDAVERILPRRSEGTGQPCEFVAMTGGLSINTGVLLLRSTNATRHLVGRWLSLQRGEGPMVTFGAADQLTLQEAVLETYLGPLFDGAYDGECAEQRSQALRNYCFRRRFPLERRSVGNMCLMPCHGENALQCSDCPAACNRTAAVFSHDTKLERSSRA